MNLDWILEKHNRIIECYFALFKAILPAKYAKGIYAKRISVTENHTGDGSITTEAIPPAKKKTPITNAIIIFLLAATNPATNAPTNVPKACAKNGIKKCLGSNKCIEAFRPSVVVTSAPFGGGMI